METWNTKIVCETRKQRRNHVTRNTNRIIPDLTCCFHHHCHMFSDRGSRCCTHSTQSDSKNNLHITIYIFTRRCWVQFRVCSLSGCNLLRLLSHRENKERKSWRTHSFFFPLTVLHFINRSWHDYKDWSGMSYIRPTAVKAVLTWACRPFDTVIVIVQAQCVLVWENVWVTARRKSKRGKRRGATIEWR